MEYFINRLLYMMNDNEKPEWKLILEAFTIAFIAFILLIIYIEILKNTW